jgi:hypothetical protein
MLAIHAAIVTLQGFSDIVPHWAVIGLDERREMADAIERLPKGRNCQGLEAQVEVAQA